MPCRSRSPDTLLEVDTDEVWATEAGPFFVASFIVAVGPNAGWFESLETGIRRFAQRLAGIPEDLFDLVNVIKRFDVLDPEISRSLPNEVAAKLGTNCRRGRADWSGPE